MRKKLASVKVTLLMSGRARIPTALHSLQMLSLCWTSIDQSRCSSSTQHVPRPFSCPSSSVVLLSDSCSISEVSSSPSSDEYITIFHQDKLTFTSIIKIFGHTGLWEQWPWVSWSLSIWLLPGVVQSRAAASPNVAFPNFASVVWEPNSSYDNCSDTFLVHCEIPDNT